MVKRKGGSKKLKKIRSQSEGEIKSLERVGLKPAKGEQVHRDKPRRNKNS